MRKNGGGSIINASSVEGLAGMAGCTAYAATKWAIRGMTKCAAPWSSGRKGIRVNSVHPGMIDTPMTRVHGGDAAMEFGATKSRCAGSATPRTSPRSTSSWPATSRRTSTAPRSPSTAE